MSDSPRTSAPSDLHTRFAERVDLREPEHDDVPVESCSRCGSPHADAWMSEGAVSGVLVCVACGATPASFDADGFEVHA